MGPWVYHQYTAFGNDHVMHDHVVDKLLLPLENEVQFKKSMNTTFDSDLYYARIIRERTSALKMNSQFFQTISLLFHLA